MRINEVEKQVTQAQLDALETVLDRVFAQLGIDVEFTRHFLDRVNDERNIRQITIHELAQLFKKEFVKWGKPIARLGPDAEAVMKDLASDINIPFALNWNKGSGMLELVAKTVMRKKNFRTPNQEFPVETYALTAKQQKRIDESFIAEAAPAFSLGGLDPAAFQQRYGVSAKQAANAFNNIRSLNPAFNNPRFSSALNQYLLNNPGAFQAANDNFNPRTQSKPISKLPGLAGKVLGTIGLILTPTAAGEGEDLQLAQMRQIQDFEQFLLSTDPQAYKDLMDDYASRMSDQELKGGFDPRQTDEYRAAEEASRMLKRQNNNQLPDPIEPVAPEVDSSAPAQPTPAAPGDEPITPANVPQRPRPRVVPTQPTPTAPDATPSRPEPGPEVTPSAPAQPTPGTDEPETIPSPGEPDAPARRDRPRTPATPTPDAPPRRPEPAPDRPAPGPEVTPSAPAQPKPTAPDATPGIPSRDKPVTRPSAPTQPTPTAPDATPSRLEPGPEVTPSAPTQPTPTAPDATPGIPSRDEPVTRPSAPTQPTPTAPDATPSRPEPGPEVTPSAPAQPTPGIPFEPVPYSPSRDKPVTRPSAPTQPTPTAPDATPSRPEPGPEVTPSAPTQPTPTAPDATPEPQTQPDVSPRPVQKPSPLDRPATDGAPQVDIEPAPAPIPTPVPRPITKAAPPKPAPSTKRPGKKRGGEREKSPYDNPLQRWVRQWGQNF